MDKEKKVNYENHARIEAGWGIYAGLRVRINKTEYRTVIALTEPRNLMCGIYKQPE